MDGEQKKERPQNANLKPLGSGKLTPEQELAIRRKGKIAADKKRKENADVRKVVRALLNTKRHVKGKAVEPEDVSSLEAAEFANITGITSIVLQEYNRYMQTGDKESRDWLVNLYGGMPGTSDPSVTVPLDQDSEGGPGVRIQLIRGAKPTSPPPPECGEPDMGTVEDAATRTDDESETEGGADSV